MDLRSLIDWAAPWYSLVADRGRTIASVHELSYTLNAHGSPARTALGRPVRFIAQDSAPRGRAYEAHIAASGEVPTRSNLHDLFNALVWFSCPRTKVMLNTRQAVQIARDGVRSRRGPVRDAATLFDENGVLLVTRSHHIVEALRRRDWRTALVEHRGAWGDEVRPIVFGHALMEKLVRPWKSITGHVWHVNLDPRAPLDAVDAAVAASIAANDFSPKRFSPLPVLGIPGWWHANADHRFYDDPQVFRGVPSNSPIPVPELG